MNNKEALQRVQSVTHIPEHYQLTIEDFKEGKFLFCWKDPKEDKGIVTEFNDNGNLVYFTKDEELGNGEHFSKKERERIALRFINDHTSASLADFSYHTQTQHGDHLRLTYRQQQMNLPLQAWSSLLQVTEKFSNFVITAKSDSLRFQIASCQRKDYDDGLKINSS